MAEIATLATIASAAFGAGSMLGSGKKEPAQAAAPEPAKPVTMADPEDPRVKAEKMRQRVFADRSAKARLEAILHPLIGTEASRQAAAAGARPVVFDVPLLAESSHWRARVDRVLVIDCEVATQVARVAQRPGWTEQAARRVIAQQAPRAARRAIADAVICNDQLTIEQLQAELRALWSLWCPHAADAA
jgi:dephospho-CoA kinase